MKTRSSKTEAADITASTTGRPVLFRLPKPSQLDPFFQGNRSFWNELILPTADNGFKPPVRSIVQRKAGCAKGRRFIVFESAAAYFNRLAAQTDQEQAELATTATRPEAAR